MNPEMNIPNEIDVIARVLREIGVEVVAYETTGLYFPVEREGRPGVQNMTKLLVKPVLSTSGAPSLSASREPSKSEPRPDSAAGRILSLLRGDQSMTRAEAVAVLNTALSQIQ